MADIKQGYLYKQGGMIKTWKKRYFALVDRTFQYYEDKAAADVCNCDGTGAIDSINLDNAKLTLYKTQDVSRPYTLGIQPHGVKRNYLITTESQQALKDWVVALLDRGVDYSQGSPTIHEINGGDTTKISQYSVVEGFLFKQGGRIKTWKLRYFIVENGLLHYYKGVEPEHIKSAIRSIPLSDAQVHHLSITESQQHVIQLPKGSVLVGHATAIRLIPPPGQNLRTFVFVAHNEAEAALWVEKIQRAINGNDRETGEEDEQNLESFTEEKKEPIKPIEVVPEPVVVQEIKPVVIEEAVPAVITPPEPVAPKRPEKPKKPTRELSHDNTKLMFRLLDQLSHGEKPDLKRLPAELVEDINAQLLNLGLSPLDDLVMGLNPVSLHPSMTQNNQPLLSTPAMTSNLGVTSGWLLRQQDNGEWKLRWCVINRGTKALRYWTSPADLRAHAKPLKTVSLLDCKWKSSNDENCDVVPHVDFRGNNNDDVYLTIKPVTAFGAGKAQADAAAAADGKKKAADKKLAPLLFAAPNAMLRDKWLEAIRDASKDLDTEDNIDYETGEVKLVEKPRSMTGRLSVFAKGLVSGKKDQEKKEETKKAIESQTLLEEGNEDEEAEGNDIKFANTSVLQQQMAREQQKTSLSPQAMQQRQSVIGDVRRMPIDSDSDDDIPLPPPRKPTQAPVQPERPQRNIAEEQERQRQEQQRQAEEQERQRQAAAAAEQERQRQAAIAAAEQQRIAEEQERQRQYDQPFDEDQLREDIENDIITWIKQCDISFPLMLTSLYHLFQQFPCPRFENVQQFLSQMSDPSEFSQIPLEVLKHALIDAFNFLHPDNMIHMINQLNLPTNMAKQRILITAEMAAEALESAYDDFKEQFD